MPKTRKSIRLQQNVSSNKTVSIVKPNTSTKKEYVDIKKYWKKIRPFAESPEATLIWQKDLEKYDTGIRMYGRDMEKNSFDKDWFNQTSHRCYLKPSDYDSCDWRCDKIGRSPAFWDYVAHGKCHWLVNFNLYLAQKTFPNKSWRIISSKDHSCVWDGHNKLFDMNFFAMEPNVKEHPFYENLPKKTRVLPIGKELKIWITDKQVNIFNGYIKGEISIKKLNDTFFS
jgi:hypothetical protein